MAFDYSNRVKKIPPYLFAEIEEKVRIKQSQGVDIIDSESVTQTSRHQG